MTEQVIDRSESQVADHLPAVRGNGAALAHVAPVAAVSLLPVPQMQAVLAEYDERRKAFRRWLLSKLEEGVHYGVVPGTEHRGSPVNPRQWRTNKPSLYKAGADFVCDLLMMDPVFSPDVDAWKMLGGKAGTVVICCRLVSRGDSPFFPGRAKGDVLGEGRGAGVDGVKKRDANAALKIAQKSAKVDAVINALGLSDLFTQDMEDAPPAPRDQPDADPSQPRVAPRAERAAQPAGVTAKDLNDLHARWAKRAGKPVKGTAGEFVTWAAGVLGREDVALLRVPGNWTAGDLERCEEVML